MPDLVRTFAGLEIPPETKDAIGKFCDEMCERPGGRELKWVRPAILHVTVRFFGDLDRKRLDRAREAIASLDQAWDPPDLLLGEVGAFPSLRRPQVLWLGIEDPSGGLAALADQTDRAIRHVGFGHADKPFVGHLTLARVSRNRRAPDMEGLTSGLTPPRGALTIRCITLFQSELRADGPIYTPLVVAQPRSRPATPGDRAVDR